MNAEPQIVATSSATDLLVPCENKRFSIIVLPAGGAAGAARAKYLQRSLLPKSPPPADV